MNHILELRKKSGLSQKKLAETLFVNQTAVSQWERGITTPNSQTLLTLSNIFDTTTDYLLGKEKAATLSDDGLDSEFASLIGQLTQSEQKLLLAQINGILQSRE